MRCCSLDFVVNFISTYAHMLLSLSQYYALFLALLPFPFLADAMSHQFRHITQLSICIL